MIINDATSSLEPPSPLNNTGLVCNQIKTCLMENKPDLDQDDYMSIRKLTQYLAKASWV
jgi:hypothetical protein